MAEFAKRNEQIWSRIPQAEQDVYMVTKNLCEYLRTIPIHNLLLLDKAARPAWHAVSLYWDSHYPEEQRPDMYFLNPAGMKPSAVERKGVRRALPHVAERLADGWFTGMDFPLIEVTQIRTRKEILQEFPRTYAHLMKRRTEPTLVFDTCLHSGETMKPVLVILKHVGFTDLRIGVASNHGNSSGILPDFIAHPATPYFPCHVFSHDFSVRKTFGKSSSLRSEMLGKEDTQHKDALRAELREILGRLESEP